jgi:hypothetical protein
VLVGCSWEEEEADGRRNPNGCGRASRLLVGFHPRFQGRGFGGALGCLLALAVQRGLALAESPERSPTDYRPCSSRSSASSISTSLLSLMLASAFEIPASSGGTR